MSKLIDLSELSTEDYQKFLDVKSRPNFKVNGRVLEIEDVTTAIASDESILPSERHLFDYQRFIVSTAFQKRRYAIFADCGLGKTAMFLAWIRRVKPLIGDKKILIISPLMVLKQTIEEEKKFYGESTISDIHKQDIEEWAKEDGRQIAITNLDKFQETRDLSGRVEAVILDESSILKNTTGKIRTGLIESTRGIQFKLCCTATPAPNDREEYANHAAFLEYVRSNNEFYSMFFVNRDNGWEIKPHGLEGFYSYLSNWSVYCRNPERYGFSDNLDVIPSPSFTTIQVPWTPEQEAVISRGLGGEIDSRDAMNRAQYYQQLSKGFLKKGSDYERIPSNKPKAIIEILNQNRGRPTVIWVVYNEEEKALLIDLVQAGFSAKSISGSTDEEERAGIIQEFREGKFEILVSKPKLLGFGINLPFVTVQIFNGMTDSYEQFYQSVRRSYRFGQKESVSVYLPVTNAEVKILDNVLRKKETFEIDSNRQEDAFITNLKPEVSNFLSGVVSMTNETESESKESYQQGNDWIAYRGDNVKVLAQLEKESVDFAVFSPPFSNLFAYSNEIQDMGNSREASEFYLHFEFFLKRLHEVLKQGRLVCCHLSQLAALKSIEGYVGLKDFRGDMIRLFQRHGFIYFGEWCIAKNPQMQAIKEKVRSLSFKQLETDRLGSKPGLNDYILIFKKKGQAVTILDDSTGPTRNEWIDWATGIWTGINESDTLNVRGTKGDDDVKHICPMNLQVIRRCIRMYSGPGETVLDPFMGIGSSGVEALKLKRKFIGIELKGEYFDESVKNLKETQPLTTIGQDTTRLDLFSFDEGDNSGLSSINISDPSRVR